MLLYETAKRHKRPQTEPPSGGRLLACSSDGSWMDLGKQDLNMQMCVCDGTSGCQNIPVQP